MEMNKDLQTYKNVAGSRILFNHHQDEHFEEILARWMIIKFGTPEFVEKFLPGKVANLGVDDSIFNEHPQNGKMRKKNECCATLVAKALDVNRKPELQVLLNHAYFSDTGEQRSNGKNPRSEERHHTLESARATKNLHKLHTGKPVLVAKMVIEAHIEPNYYEQCELFANKEVYDKKVEFENVSWANSKSLKVAIATTDNSQMHKYAFLRGVDMIVLSRSTGHVHIFTNERIKEKFGEAINLCEVAKVIRYDEQYRGKVVEERWSELHKEGVVGAPNWWFQVKGQMLLNGCYSYPNVEPTKIHYRRIVELIKMALDPNKFHPNRDAICKSGRCLSSREKSCGWRKYQLQKCSVIRSRIFRNRKKAKTEETVTV